MPYKEILVREYMKFLEDHKGIEELDELGPLLREGAVEEYYQDNENKILKWIDEKGYLESGKSNLIDEQWKDEIASMLWNAISTYNTNMPNDNILSAVGISSEKDLLGKSFLDLVDLAKKVKIYAESLYDQTETAITAANTALQHAQISEGIEVRLHDLAE
jgi:hypothetical protein